MTEIFDALEICLQEIENGADVDSALAKFPEHASELLPIVVAAAKAKNLASSGPSADVQRRSRARVMQRAAELREAKSAPRRRMIPAFTRLAISFALTALLLFSGTGLINASASALPGENLYPVKRGWENIRLFFIFDPLARTMLENELENERFEEVNELLREGRHEVIQFAGVFMRVNGVDYVSGLKVILPDGVQIPANGSAVIVSGRTNAQGFVEVIGIELLPAGSVVPAGKPIEMESENESEGDQTSKGGSGSGSDGEAGLSEPAEYEISGTLESVSPDSLVVSGMTILLDGAMVDGRLCVGVSVEVKGYYADDGSFIAREVKSEGSCAGSAPGGSNANGNSSEGTSNQDSGSQVNSNENESGGGDNSNDDDSNDDDSNDDDSNDDDSNDDDSNDDDSNDDSGGGDDD